MSMTKLFRIVSKLLSLGFTVGSFGAYAVKLKRTQRSSSWLKRSRFVGSFERICRFINGVIIIALVAFVLLIIVTSI